MSKPHAYIDTSVLYSNGNNTLLTRISFNYTIVIPQIVIGETIAIILTKQANKDIITSSLQFINSITNYKNNMPSLDEKVICHALALKEQEYNLDMCDCVILAHAIVDENAQRLFTFDRTLVTSRNIKEYVKNNNPNLKITDSI